MLQGLLPHWSIVTIRCAEHAVAEGRCILYMLPRLEAITSNGLPYLTPWKLVQAMFHIGAMAPRGTFHK
jgi:hypothetical protein